MDKLDFVEIKNFCSPKVTVKRVKRHVTDWEKIFANHIFDKGLVFRTWKQANQLKSRLRTRADSSPKT